jgi:tetratricopeptide (TPR) repeat protein
VIGQVTGGNVINKVEGNVNIYNYQSSQPPRGIPFQALVLLKDYVDRPEDLNQNPVGTPQNLPRSGVVEFVGRDTKLIELHEQLQNNKRIAIVAIAGMGGIGKTELALQYAIEQLQQNQYPAGICWLRARDREIATDIVTFAQVHLGLSLPDQLEIDAQVRFCWQRWPKGEALVVLDDVTDYQAIEPYLPPADPRFKLLITTRLDLGSTVRKVSLEELDEDGAIALLESLVGGDRVRSQLADTQALCEWVGYLPLALELLGRFLARKLDWSIDRLLKALEDQRLDAKALVKTENGMTGQLGVVAALELSWKELNEAEHELACVLGMFAIAPIPWSLVEGCQPDIEPDELEGIRDDGLMARSLLKRVGDSSYQLHQIVQEYFRIKLSERGDQGQAIKAIFWQVMVRIARGIEERPTINQIEQVRDLIAHLEGGVRSWIDSITDEDFMCPFVGIGHFYESQGNYLFAEPWYGDCLEGTKQRLGEQNLYVAMSLSNLAKIYCFQGKYGEAESFGKSTLEMYKLIGEEHSDVAESLNNLAVIYKLQGKYEEAEPLYRSALEKRKQMLGEEHSDVAESLNNLAGFYHSQGKYEEAELLCLSALEMSKRLLGEEHRDVTSSMNNLAEIYSSQGKYEEAEPLYRLALEQRKRMLGEDHPDVAISLNNLAGFYYSQGKYEEAELLCLSALDIYKRMLEEVIPDVALTRNNLAEIYSSQGKYEEAEPIYRLALEQRKWMLGEDHPDVVMSLRSLAGFYHLQGKYEEAEPIYRLVLEQRKRMLGEDHPDIATSLNDLARLYSSQGKYGEAELLFCSAWERYERLLGKEHPNVATSLWNLGDLYQNQGRYQKAEALYRQALAIAKSKLGSDHPTTQGILSWLNSLPQPPA